jgi:hypothetical protein
MDKYSLFVLEFIKNTEMSSLGRIKELWLVHKVTLDFEELNMITSTSFY